MLIFANFCEENLKGNRIQNKISYTVEGPAVIYHYFYKIKSNQDLVGHYIHAKNILMRACQIHLQFIRTRFTIFAKFYENKYKIFCSIIIWNQRLFLEWSALQPVENENSRKRNYFWPRHIWKCSCFKFFRNYEMTKFSSWVIVYWLDRFLIWEKKEKSCEKEKKNEWCEIGKK